MRLAVLCLVVSAGLSPPSRAQAPVFKITHEDSSIKFSVKASVALEGTFEKWDTTINFTSPDISTGILEIKIQADSVNTGSGMKDGKLKSKDFFDVKDNPTITFLSKKFVQTGPETLTFTSTGAGTGAGDVKGTMAFDRKEFGMNSGIPFIKIADRVEVAVDLKWKRVSGPPLDLKR